MDFGKLSAAERLAAYGSIIAIVGTLLTVVGGFVGAGGLWLTLLLAIAMLVLVFLPQWSPQTTLPGSKGSLMLVVGGIAAFGALLGLLALVSYLGFLGDLIGEAFLYFIGLLLGIVGGLMMAWAGWQAFQAEGGKFRLGSATTSSGSTPPPARPAAPPPPGERPMGDDPDRDRTV